MRAEGMAGGQGAAAGEAGAAAAAAARGGGEGAADPLVARLHPPPRYWTACLFDLEMLVVNIEPVS